MSRLTLFDWLALPLFVLGGVNWGLVGLFKYDLFAALFGSGSWGTRICYVLVGVATLYLCVTSYPRQKHVMSRQSLYGMQRA